MKFNRLKLMGFKSFVDPADFYIEKGLTGVVGPNGCGKSNLVEALRWVMGESSYKNMRASGMDDVIFSGSGNRPARNTAEVVLFLDNSERTAPALFNDADELQISRRIEREAGSVYRINGKDARARDVQLLFADQSTGARSPSMVGQGRIGELISARPQARRAILEEAAGISGLNTRRHEAELRLKAAESNLERLADVVAQLDSQIENLKRQARQANRYKQLSAEIRKAEAMLLYLRWIEACEGEGAAEAALTEATAQMGRLAQLQAAAATKQAVLAHGMPKLREQEAEASSALQRLMIARNQIDGEMSRLAARQKELQDRLQQLDGDFERENNLIAENAGILSRLDLEEAGLRQQQTESADLAHRLREGMDHAAARLVESESKMTRLTSEFAEWNARKGQATRNLAKACERMSGIDRQIAAVAKDILAVDADIAAAVNPEHHLSRVDALEQAIINAEAAVSAAEQASEAARGDEQAARMPVNEAREQQNTLKSEAAMLERICSQSENTAFAAIVETITVEPGFETALGAALGEDLNAALDNNAPVFFRLLDETLAASDSALPAGVTCLADHVTAPPQLHRRLRQIGVVEAGEGMIKQAELKSGQRLVSRQGQLWRWDGLVAGSEAPSEVALKLTRRNRLAALTSELAMVLERLQSAEKTLIAARSMVEAATADERQKRDHWRNLQRDLSIAREQLAKAESFRNQLLNRKAGFEADAHRLNGLREESESEIVACEKALGEIPDLGDFETKLSLARAGVAEDRAALVEARAAHDSHEREAAIRSERLVAIATERQVWKLRATNAAQQLQVLGERIAASRRELVELENGPAEFSERRRQVVASIESGEIARRQAADALAAGELALAEADREAKQALETLTRARETAIRDEERVNSLRERRHGVEARIREDLDCDPQGARQLSGMDEGARLADIATVEGRLDRARSDRERLGAVNLRAESEEAELVENRTRLVSERDDLTAAIRRLRQGIQSLNREGRERLLEAFERVNTEFQRLFTHLFGGGTAELQLVESDDPLQSGLEILARPPGKKPQTMTLLSGGEQALTAMALIFAVFLTNPSPICVLDEVDAPLDDHNVERFCNLMDEMAASTDTRFIIITHNPITMARVDRLFGVTMAERGVSQLVSVDLQEASSYREAG